jgi:MFS transporter, BCD family, chlorophyll transporter
VAFLLVGAGLHTTQTAGLALATDLAPPESQPKVVGLMYVMLLFGTIVSALVFGQLLTPFSPGRLVQVIQGAAVVTMVLNGLALWKQETRDRSRALRRRTEPSFAEAWKGYMADERARRRLLAIGLGTMAFSMQDVLLEPFGGQVLGLSVGATTTLTASLAFGALVGFSWASRVLGRGADPFRMAGGGALLGVPAFALVILSASFSSVPVFALGAMGVGFAGGLFAHGTLTATMNSAPRDQAGLALGAWGAVQATAAGAAVALGGIINDSVAALARRGHFGAALTGPNTGYLSVYALEILMLAATVWLMASLQRKAVPTTTLHNCPTSR